MSNDDILTDEYVAGLLAKDAQDCSLKYSAMGMEAFKNDKKPANMPKPNTRFLRHIINTTDTHNKNLLAKEAAESKARLQDLEHTEEVRRLKTNPNSRDIRRRQMGDIHAILGGKRPRRKDDDDSPSSRRRDGDDDRRSSKKDKDLFKDRESKRRHGRLEEDGERVSKIRGRSEKSSRRRRDDDSDSEDDERRRRHERRRRDRSRSRSPGRRRRRSRSPDDKRKSTHRHRSPVQETKKSPRATSPKNAEDSDPLDDLIGPMPAPTPRGRGAVAGSSGIDRRFSETYDPKLDVQMDDDEGAGGNWDDAVEAFRDRQKLRQAQEQRMKSAGFADADIQRAQGTTEQMDEDFTWTRAGEKREWDKDKVQGEDGF